MSLTSNDSPSPEGRGYDLTSVPRWVSILFIVAFVLLAYLLYASVSDRRELETGLEKANQENKILAAQLDKSTSLLDEMKGQVDVAAQKLGFTQDEAARAHSLAQKLREDQKVADAQIRSQITSMQQDNAQKFGQINTDLTGTKKDLEDTKARLGSAVGDLGVQSGLIARNHEEVEDLKRMNDRNIIEFNLGKSKGPQRVGPIQLTLKKVDPKHYRYTVSVLADDKDIEKKDRTADEPVQFYVHGARTPYEIVVYEVDKDRIKGYLSTPKDQGPAPPPADQAGSSAPPGN